MQFLTKMRAWDTNYALDVADACIRSLATGVTIRATTADIVHHDLKMITSSPLSVLKVKTEVAASITKAV